jgi:hypothetical protein
MHVNSFSDVSLILVQCVRNLTFVHLTKAALVMELVGEEKSLEKVMLVLFGLGNNSILT